MLGRERGEGAAEPSEYSLLCNSLLFFSSHSSHFFTVPPNSQYYWSEDLISDVRSRLGSGSDGEVLLLVVDCILGKC